MEIEIHELRSLLKDAAELGSLKTLIAVGQIPEMISQREAYKLYGEGVVKRWVKEGLLRRHKDGDATSKVRYSRIELDTLNRSNNRRTYLNTEERKTNL